MNWYDAKNAAASIGKRLCTAREWTLAAEGPHMHPLPYGDGYHRDGTICNFDRPLHINQMNAKRPDDSVSQAMREMLVPSGSMPDCHSDYGVYDMAGNIDEWVINEGGGACTDRSTGNCISGLKGGHMLHVRNASRPMTTAHGPGFGWWETGARFCKETSP